MKTKTEERFSLRGTACLNATKEATTENERGEEKRPDEHEKKKKEGTFQKGTADQPTFHSLPRHTHTCMHSLIAHTHTHTRRLLVRAFEQ